MHITLSQSFTDTDVTNYSTLATGIMGGCVTVIVFGSTGTRAQHCAGGFQALDNAILGVGNVEAIIVAAPMLFGNDQARILNWVGANKGNGRAMFVNRDCTVNLDHVRQGHELPTCVT